MQRYWLIPAVFTALVLSAAPAAADAVLTLNNSGGFGNTYGVGTTFGTVDLHQCTNTELTNPCSVGTVQITVALNVVPVSGPAPTGPYNFANANSTYTVQWNLKGNPNLGTKDATIVSPTASFDAESGASGQGLKATPFTTGNCGTCFEYGVAVNTPGTSGHVTGPLIFDVTNQTANLLISDFAVAVGGVYFTVDMGINGNTATVGASTGGANTQNLPEPATLLIFGAGAAGAAAMRRRKRKSEV